MNGHELPLYMPDTTAILIENADKSNEQKFVTYSIKDQTKM